MATVRDIMTRPVVIHSSDTIENAIRLMQANEVRSLVVEKCHEDGCYGILIEEDIVHHVVASGRDPRHVRVGSLMWQACAQIPLGATTQEAAQILSDAQICHAPVVENHRLLGVVSVSDILAQLCTTESASDKSQLFWRSRRTPNEIQGRAIQARAAQMAQRDNEALVSFEDDMRYGCKTLF
ncbi:MAG: CBS domain-containing protein [Elainellaceae cyanobacterium]